MAQIKKGTTYATGGSVTAANLNAHVDGATLLPGALLEQPQALSVSGSNQILVSDGVGLSKATLATMVTGLSLFDKSQAQTLTQNLSVTNGASLTLSSGSILTLGQNPTSALQAVPKQYADSTFFPLIGGNVSGAISMIGTSSFVSLAANPTQSLHAATKGYVDGQSLLAENGYQVFSNGLTINWGVYDIPISGSDWQNNTVLFAKPFPNNCFTVVLIGNENAAYAPVVISKSKPSFIVQYYRSVSTVTRSVYWIAIGN